MCIQTGFMPGGLVFGHQTMGNRAVDRRNSSFVCSACSFFVAAGYGFNHILDGCTYVRTLAGVALPVLLSLTGPFAS